MCWTKLVNCPHPQCKKNKKKTFKSLTYSIERSWKSLKFDTFEVNFCDPGFNFCFVGSLWLLKTWLAEPERRNIVVSVLIEHISLIWPLRMW